MTQTVYPFPSEFASYGGSTVFKPHCGAFAAFSMPDKGWGQNMAPGPWILHFGVGPWTTYMDWAHGPPVMDWIHVPLKKN